MKIWNQDRRLEIADYAGITTQKDFEEILDQIASLRLEKARRYGDQLLGVEDKTEKLWLAYSNVFRKSNRLRQLHKLVLSEEPQALESLIDCYMDLANYAIMNIQILKGEVDENRTNCD